MIKSDCDNVTPYGHVDDPTSVFRDLCNEVFGKEISGKFHEYFLNSGNDFLYILIDKTRLVISKLFDWGAIDGFERWVIGESEYVDIETGCGKERALKKFEMSCNTFRRNGDKEKVFRLSIQRHPDEMPKVKPAKFNDVNISFTDPLPSLVPVFFDRVYFVYLEYDGTLVSKFDLLIPSFSAKLNNIVLKKGKLNLGFNSIWDKHDLKKWQNRMGYSYEEAADALGVSRATFSNYLRRNEPIPIVLSSACILFEMYYLENYRMSPDELLRKMSSDDD